MQRFLNMAVLAGLCGCAGGAATSGAVHGSTAHEATASTQSTATQSEPAASAAVQTTPEAAAAGPQAQADAAPLPARVDAGSIPRSALVAVLSSGVPRFLQKVHADPHLVGGRFVGWRLVTLFDGENQVRVLRVGDTVLSVNGEGIERPEQFKAVWDKVAARDELVLLVQRNGARSELHYQIVQ